MFFSTSTSSKLKNIYSLGFVVGFPAVVYQINELRGPNTRMLKVKPCYSFRLYARAALPWMKKKRLLRNEKLKANRASETEEQSKERLRIKREKRK